MGGDCVTEIWRDLEHALKMKKILLIVLGIVVAAGLVAFMVIKQQSSYTRF